MVFGIVSHNSPQGNVGLIDKLGGGVRMPRVENVFNESLLGLLKTKPGTERNMYPYIKDILVNVLGHDGSSMCVDSSPSSRLNHKGIPDISVSVRHYSSIILERWIIVEAKDEAGIFKNERTKEKIFAEKEKYITSDTEWFVMVDPRTWVIRNVTPEGTEMEDLVFDLEGITYNQFLIFCTKLTLKSAHEKERIKRFRLGEEKWIASRKLVDRKNEQAFYTDLNKCFSLLLTGCESALELCESEYISPLNQLISIIEKTYGEKCQFYFEPFRIKSPQKNIDNLKSYREYASKLKQFYYKAPKTFHLVTELLPELNYESTPKDAFKHVALNTSSLIFARILMLRFLEDHNFFGEKKYLSNGGIKAFNKMREYFKNYYPNLIEQVFQQGAKIHPDSMGESEADWILESSSEELSQSIEQVLFYLSFYDFSTVRSDILSGIYQKILDNDIQKRYGQVYTPPTIARYLVNKAISLASSGKVLDPSCGTGTFLVEWFEKDVGEAIRRGVTTYEHVCNKLLSIRGNDINPVASSITQMQLLWKMFSFNREIKQNGFPNLQITNADALKISDLFDLLAEWYEIDCDPDKHAVLLGNPPFVRSERQTIDYSTEEEKFYRPVSLNSNLYVLFPYKAMTQWLKEDGILCFVLPLSILDSKGSQKFRNLFKIGGKWLIKEIVDMEEITRFAFPGVGTNVILFIAQKTPPNKNDKITIRITGKDVAVQSECIWEFNFDKASTESFAYNDVFSKDGRILPRINQQRKKIIDKLWGFPTWKDISLEVWQGKKGNKIIEIRNDIPQDGNLKWEKRKMLGMGGAFRGQKYKTNSKEGCNVYKGENILACQVIGPPAEENIDISKMDDPSFWKFTSVLPSVGFAFQQISLNLTAAKFNPHRQVFLNTATLFFPSKDVEQVPFDFLVLSSVYQWYFAVSQREGIIQKHYAHIYPRTIERLPWSEKISNYTDTINILRNKYLNACKESNKVVLNQLWQVPLESLRERAEKNKNLMILWLDSPQSDQHWFRYSFEDDYEFFYINDQKTYELLKILLPLIGINEANREEILKIKLPATSEGEAVWHKISSGKIKKEADNNKRKAIEELDNIIGKAFNLSEEEVEFIQSDLTNDSLFKKLKPKEPFSQKNIRGLLSGLNKSNRYHC